MSREDLERLEGRARRRGWLAAAAKALGGLAVAAALAAAGVITVRTVRPAERSEGGERGSQLVFSPVLLFAARSCRLPFQSPIKT
jgi:hypothetical protein